jgi:hypothetical protein
MRNISFKGNNQLLRKEKKFIFIMLNQVFQKLSQSQTNSNLKGLTVLLKFIETCLIVKNK